MTAPAPNIEIYEVKHAEPDDLIRLIKALVPGVTVLAGPSPSALKRGFEAERLGDLPFFVHLFRNTQKSRSSSEIVILLKASAAKD